MKKSTQQKQPSENQLKKAAAIASTSSIMSNANVIKCVYENIGHSEHDTFGVDFCTIQKEVISASTRLRENDLSGIEDMLLYQAHFNNSSLNEYSAISSNRSPNLDSNECRASLRS